jgi:lysozyme
MNEILERVIELLKRFEGRRLHSYQDVVGVWTIGYGETLNIGPGMLWTMEQADTQLRQRALGFTLAVFSKCPQLHQEPIDRVAACVSLAYNVGIAGFGISSVCRLTARKQYKRASQSFALWNKAGGAVDKGLTWRRGEEARIYLSPSD